MQLRNYSLEIFVSFEEFKEEVSFLYEVMDLNEDMRDLMMLHEMLKDVNIKVMEQWRRLQRSMSSHRLTQQEASLIRLVIITLQECERELENLRDAIPEPYTCPRCGKPYFKEPEGRRDYKN